MMTENITLEGENVTLTCKYDSSGQNLQWYRQYPESSPEYVLLVFGTTGDVIRADPQNLRLSAKVHSDSNHVSMEISSVMVSDSALYYCALGPTVTGNPINQHKNLHQMENSIFIYSYYTLFVLLFH